MHPKSANPRPDQVLVTNALFLVVSVKRDAEAPGNAYPTTRVMRQAVMKVDDAPGNTARLTLWNGEQIWSPSSARQIEKLLVEASMKYDRAPLGGAEAAR